MSDEELKHQEKTSAEQLFRLRFQVALGQNDGVKKLRQLRKEIAQIKTVARERELGIHGETGKTSKLRRAEQGCKTEDAAEGKAAKAKAEAPAGKNGEGEEAAPGESKTAKTKTAASAKKTAKAKGASK